MVGVPKPELTAFVARCLQRLGTKRAWVVNGSGLDELTLAGPTTVAEVDGETVRSFTIGPEDAGLAAAPLESLRGGDPQANAAIARDVLAGRPGPEARRGAAERRRGARGGRQGEGPARRRAARRRGHRRRARQGARRSRAGGPRMSGVRTGSVLDAILARTRESVEREKTRRPLEAGHPDVAGAPAVRPFAAALARPGAISVIAEHKRRSPSRGAIREDLEPADVARRYEAAGAAALSVLTDEPFFGGRLAHLTRGATGDRAPGAAQGLHHRPVADPGGAGRGRGRRAADRRRARGRRAARAAGRGARRGRRRARRGARARRARARARGRRAARRRQQPRPADARGVARDLAHARRRDPGRRGGRGRERHQQRLGPEAARGRGLRRVPRRGAPDGLRPTRARRCDVLLEEAS